MYIYDTDFELVETIEFPKKMNNIVCNIHQEIDSAYKSYYTRIIIIGAGVETRGDTTVVLNNDRGYQLVKSEDRFLGSLLFFTDLDYIDFHIHKKILYVQNKKYKLQ